ncbi:dipeptide/oligopeptide/nickel ABC transporter permease/ATP-binding protein [Dactylosporangium roseum]|uniref:Dipeptide/oligopeptide/nickel ABC transporter permease/ATP-binding protein n=1 Tax=Dactylosporangium roseum TaxID=47989 RepID=A0ABY5ZEQ1_9ACTN|nr:dipeptide/oligopeptide/nickel ABC transporter permease/ATP-binding protein [Dactylosporangium roseum]UWZ39237.1 dipeptide/oligopeptide/nickel ABC transporter permease/ATP-binding protein [Dactylosporangium roseum]
MAASTSALRAPRKARRLAWAGSLRSGYGLVGSVTLGILVLVAVFAPLLAPEDPHAITSEFLSPPSGAHLLGTDLVGHDLLSQLVYGARVTLLVAGTAAVISFGLGVLVGSVAGYFRGPVDTLLMKVTEFFQIIPSLVFALVLVALMGSHLWLVTLAIGLTIWPQQARIVRAQFLTLREREFVQASRALGFSDRHIIFREIYPNALGPVFVQATLDVGVAILLETALSFLGLGDPNKASWGQMLFGAQAHLERAWWLALWPGVAIALTVLAVNFVGDSLSEWFNARSDVGRVSLQRHKPSVRADRPNGGRPDVGADGRSAQAESARAESAQPENPLLRVDDLTVHLRRGAKVVRAVDHLELAVRPGERVGLVGESGSGKSMFSRAVLQMLPSANVERFSGAIELAGVDLMRLGEDAIRGVRSHDLSIVFQDPMTYLNPTMRIGRQIGEAMAGCTGKERRERVREMLTAVALPTTNKFLRQYPHELSGGMRQRVMIAMALASRPRLLIADEPTTALDVTVQAQVLRTIVAVHEARQMAMLIITHDLAIVAEVCDRAYVMYGGQIVEEAPVGRLFSAPRHPYTQGLMASMPGRARHGTGERLRGSVVDLTNVPTGCRFAARCKLVHDRCAEAPPLVRVGDERVRCWLFSDNSERHDHADGSARQLEDTGS